MAIRKKTDKRLAASHVEKDSLRKLMIGMAISASVIVVMCLCAMIMSFERVNPERMDEEEYLRFITELDRRSFNVSDSNERFLSQYFRIPPVKFLYFKLSEENPLVLDMILVTKRNPISLSLRYDEGLAIGEIHETPFLVYYVLEEEILVMKFFDGRTREREFTRSYLHKVPKD